ncbi:MAG TPA: hypothetical protein VFQ88_07740 [Nevskiaceae bacterium]|nr:hypothetical protein [Nevskiaceae bacterium]
MTAITSTPWGPPQQTRIIARGIVSVSTASHGGIHLDANLNAKVPTDLRSARAWYEEDSEWACVVATFPEHFSDRECYYATRTLESERPGARCMIAKEAYRRGDDWYLANSRKWAVVTMGTGTQAGRGEWCCTLERIDKSETARRILAHDEAFKGPFAELPGRPLQNLSS